MKRRTSLRRAVRPATVASRLRHAVRSSLIEPLEARQLLSAAAYSVTPLPGNPVGQVQAFNDAGMAAGRSDSNPDVGFLFANGKTTLFSPQAGNILTVTAMNASGQVIGYLTYQSVGGDTNVGFEYSGGNFTLLSMPAGTTASTPVAINNTGVIAGTYQLQNGISHGFTYSNGKATDIGTLGGTDTTVMAMNNSGQVVGSSDLANGDTHAFLYSGGKMTDIDPSGGTLAEADAINDAGQIIGYDNEDSTAIYYDSGTLMHPAPPFGGVLTNIFINASGEMVGQATNITGGNGLFTVTPELLADDGGIPGSTLTVTGLNNSGTVIGYSTNIQTQVQTPFVYINGAFQTIKQVGSTAVPLQKPEFINNNGQIIADQPTGSKTNSYLLKENGWISGTVFYDTNHDGIENGADGGGKVTVYLDSNYNHKLDPGEQSVVTGDNGNYNFIDPPADPEIVRLSLPSGDQQTFPANNVGDYVGKNTGQPITGQNFGYYTASPANASITGVVFNDVNANQFQDAGEPGIAGITVYIDEFGTGIFQAGDPSVVTATNGSFAFTGLAAGNYLVRAVIPSGDTQTYPPFNDAVTAIGLGPDDTYSSASISLSVPTGPTTGSISGTVFADSNHDGILDDGESGVAGVTVYLDPNYNHKLDPGEQSAVTDFDGHYVFTNPPADPEILRVVLPNGTTQTSPANGAGIYVGKNTGATLTGENFGVFFPSTITGYVYNDVNHNGIVDNGEGVANVTVYIDVNNTGSFVTGDPTAVTNNSGFYSLGNLTAGTYIVREVLPVGYTQTSPANNAGLTEVLNSSEYAEGQDFILNKPTFTAVSISGTVFIDTNGDGIQDDGETGLPLVVVYEDPNYNHQLDNSEQRTETDASGNYTLTNLPADPEIIRIVLPNGTTQTLPANGAGIYVGKNLTQSLTGENFGIHIPTPSGSISGTVFNDANGDHKFEFPSEGYQAGITAYIDLNKDGVFDAGDPSAVSDAQGDFKITGLAPGTYTVQLAPKAGFRQTFPVTGTGTNGLQTTVSGTNNSGIGFFGVTTTAYVGGTLFNDRNGNGVQDTGEAGLAGWTVYLDLNNDGIRESNEPVAQTVTTSTGYWYFRAVAPGTYTIRAVSPTGWTITHAFTVTPASGQTIINGAIGAKQP